MLLIFKEKKRGSKNNTAAILRKKLHRNNIPATIACFNDVEFLISANDVKVWVQKKLLSSWKAIFFRKVGKYKNVAHVISKVAQQEGISFVDQIYRFSNDYGKLNQMYKLAANNIPIPKTYFSPIYDNEKLNKAIKLLGFPMIVKRSPSRMGAGVFLARTRKEIFILCKQDEAKEIILQEFIPNAFDYRILILGKKVAVAEKRTRMAKNEFRNNVALGAQEEFLDLKKLPIEIKKTAIAAAIATDIQVAGVDIVVDSNNKLYVLEVNRTPAFTHDDDISNETSELANYLASLCKAP